LFVPFVTLGVAAGLMFIAAPAHSAGDAVFGINDDNAFRHHYRGSERLLTGLGNVHVGVWTSPEDHSFWPIPQSRPVLVQLLGSPDWASRPAAYAAAALRLVRAHPNIRELQVWNEPDLCWFPCAPNGDGFRFREGYVDQYLDLLAATRTALAGTGVKVLGFGFSYRVDEKWSPEDIAHAIRSWYNRRGGRTFAGVGREEGEWISVRFGGHAYPFPIMDGFAYHPYCGWESATTDRIYAALDQLQLPGGTPRLWWTESGFDTESRHGGYFGVSGGIARCSHGSEAEQAARVQQVMQEARTSRYVAGAFNFLLYDERDLSRWQTGLVRPDGSPKPAFGAFARAVG
jgi:hypothetical protein